jgi:hypothetical protein
MARNEHAVLYAVAAAFQRAGFKNVSPREDVRTVHLWLSRGRRPLEGSRCVKVHGCRLYHISQTRPLTAEEKGEAG